MKRRDAPLLFFSAISAGLVGAALLTIVAVVAFESREALPGMEGGASLFDSEWDPYSSNFGMGAMLLASLLLTAGAVVVAVPAALLVAISTNYYLPSVLRGPARRVMELASGIPSVVYGLWGLTVLVPLLSQWQQPGTSLLAGVIALALMIIPTVMLVLDAGFRALPSHHWENALALGIRRGRFVLAVALPAVTRSLTTGVSLGTARALGETMVVLMVTGNLVQIPGSVFEPVRALTANIALEMGYAMDIHRSALYVGGFLLLLLSMTIVVISHWVAGRYRHA